MRRRSGIIAALACVSASAVGACLSFGDLSGGQDPGANDGSFPGDSSSGDVVVGTDDSAALTDAGSDAPILTPDGSCSFDEPFGTPTALTALNSSTYDDWSARLSQDQLTLYFGSARPPRQDGGTAGIFVSTRSAATSAFGTPVLAPGPLTTFPYYENHPSVTSDLLSMFIETNAGGHTNIYSSTRASSSANFGTPMNVNGLNDPTMDQNAPFIMPSGTTIYLSRSAPGGGIRAVMRSSIAGGSFAAPNALTELNNPLYDSTYPVVTPDELTIYFESNRTGGSGVSDIWKAQRASTVEPFTNIEPVTELNTAYGDFPSWVSENGCTLYFFSNRAALGAASGLDLYVAQKAK